MDNNKRYNELTGGLDINLQVSISADIPVPTENDYIKGYITRFFIQKVNDTGSPIYEVFSPKYISLKSNNLYNTTSLRWRISGPRSQQSDENGNITDKGISESNRISIKLASDEISNLKLYLPNLLQFSR